jgi:glutaredoxin
LGTGLRETCAGAAQRRLRRVLAGLLCCLSLLFGLAAASPSESTLDVYIRDGCPHCAAAKQELLRIAAERPWLVIRYRPVDTDADARKALLDHSTAAGVWPPGVPTFVLDDRLRVGFDAEGDGPRELAAWIDAADIPAEAPTSVGWIEPERLGLPLFTVALGLIDGFNPCAMWVLLFLLSILVHLHDRRRMLLIAGCFVLISGLVYYAFMAAWLNLFLAVGLSSAVRVVLALVALSIAVVNLKEFLFGRGRVSVSIPETAKPSLYARVRHIVQARSLPLALFGVGVLALLVNLVELLCTAGLPALYTAVLSQQALSATAHYAYLGLYIVAYMLDDALMVGLAVAALGSRRLDVAAGRRLKLVSGLVMLGLALVMLLRPQWLI